MFTVKVQAWICMCVVVEGSTQPECDFIVKECSACVWCTFVRPILKLDDIRGWIVAVAIHQCDYACARTCVALAVHARLRTCTTGGGALVRVVRHHSYLP